MKFKKILLYSIVMGSLLTGFMETSANSLKEELYFNLQKPTKIQPDSNLESIFYFDKLLQKSDNQLKPVKGKYKTYLKIPKAKLD